MKRMKVLAIVMIFAFAALGGAYAALWKDTIKLTTTVKTGKVALKWGEAKVGDDYHGNNAEQLQDGEDSVAATLDDNSLNPNAGDNGGYPISNAAPGIRRNVGHISLNTAASTDKELVVNITNAYPDYQGEIEAYVVNAGTIPVVINSITATLNGAQVTDSSPVQYNLAVIPDPWANGDAAQTLVTTPLLGTLLEASEDGGATPHNTADVSWQENLPNKVKVKISVHVAGATDINVVQNGTYTLRINIDGTQWNGVNNDNPAAPKLLNLPDQLVSRFD